ncbi:hypothetical protein AAur_0554 [Paenarthrobacter aurescens TC1]|uniref:Uncharacterized protein n=1 Tax=Paenarthrobacter aurescens (strain TC1) TaxID=290340 RepID=A1R2A0_PAEAT|nr:hypothetical protein AAur_0554 [Paenarthrobacter aurescens TC1]
MENPSSANNHPRPTSAPSDPPAPPSPPAYGAYQQPNVPYQQPGIIPPQPKRTLNRKVIIAIAAGAAVVLAAATVGLVLLFSPAADGGQAATTFYQALKDGDAKKALSVSDPGVPENEAVLLQDNIYKAAGQHIDGFRILESKGEYVRAEVTQNGRKQEDILMMTKSPDGEWKVGPKNFQKIRLSSNRPVKSFTVNGVDVAAPDSGSASPDSQLLLPAFPGEYKLGISGDKYATVEEKKALVSIDRRISDTFETLKVLPSQLLLDETKALLQKKRDTCIASASATARQSFSSGCSGFNLYESRPTQNVKWTIDEEPTFTLSLSRDIWYIQPEGKGKATVSYEVNRGTEAAPKWEPHSEVMEPRISGEIHIVDGKATLKDY